LASDRYLNGRRGGNTAALYWDCVTAAARGGEESMFRAKWWEHRSMQSRLWKDS